MQYASYIHYYNDLMKTFEESEAELPKEARMTEDFKIVFSKKLKSAVKRIWNEAEIHERESYILFDDEFEKIFLDSLTDYTCEIMKGLSEKELVNMAIREDGEIVYSISEKGKLLLDSM